MDFRVYDKKKKKWIDEKVYLSPEGELYKSTQTFLGQNKLSSISQDRYVYQQSIDLYDKEDTLIYIGDYIQAQVAEDKVVTGIVAYANELSAYVILCFDTDEFYTLGSNVSQDIRVVGNVFDEFKDNFNKHK